MKTQEIIILTAIFCSMFANSTYSQFFVEIGSGYAMPVKNIDRLADKNYYYGSIYTNSVTRDNIVGDYKTKISRSNNMNGLFFSGEAGYRFKEFFAISLNFQYLNNNKIKFLYSEITNISHSTNIIEAQDLISLHKTEEITINTSIQSGRYFSFSPKISYIFTIKNWEIQPSIGFSYINTKSYNDLKTEIYQINTIYAHTNPIKDSIWYKSINKIILEYKSRKFIPFLFSAYFSLSFNYKFNKNISAFFLTEFNNLNLFYRQRQIQAERYYYKCSIYNGIDKNPDKEPQAVEDLTVIPNYGAGLTRREQYGNGYTNVNFSIGVRYTFNKRQK